MGKVISVNLSCTAAGQGSLSSTEAAVRSLSDRLVEAQRPIRILDAIKWDDSIEQAFFAAGCREQPPVTSAYYLRRPLPFDPDRKRQELLALEADVHSLLGSSAVGRILRHRCSEYRLVIDLLEQRGTPQLSLLSRQLYGSAADCCQTGSFSLTELARRLDEVMAPLAKDALLGLQEPVFTAAEAMRLLSSRLSELFQEPASFRVQLSDGIVADAAAGSDYIKLRGDASFTARDLRLLEVHEGWVHLGTTLNGKQQPFCTFLSKGPPSCTITQEGLAVLTEVLAFASHPGRVRRLAHRIEGAARAEAGASFLDVYRFFLAHGYHSRESYQHTMRLFRGSLPEGCGPFTKDLCYQKGFVLLYNFLRTALRSGRIGLIPLLFCGKTTLDEIDLLAEVAGDGLLAPPRFVPPPFANLHALAAWLCYSSCLDGITPACSDQAADLP